MNNAKMTNRLLSVVIVHPNPDLATRIREKLLALNPSNFSSQITLRGNLDMCLRTRRLDLERWGISAYAVTISL